MQRYVYVQLGTSSLGPTLSPPLRISGDTFKTIERGDGNETTKWVVTLGNDIVREFLSRPLAWWIQDE
jgi:hypothetical protein